MDKLRAGIIAGLIVIAGFFILKNFGASRPDTDPKDPGLLSGFENTRVWGISPERGFDISLSRKHVTQGRYSLKVRYPKWDLPSINTKRLHGLWDEYEAVTFNVFNPHKETVDFKVRIDDSGARRIVVSRTLRPGANLIRITRAELAAKIDPGQIGFVVLYIQEPKKRYTLYFDNLRLERPELLAGLLAAAPDFSAGTDDAGAPNQTAKGKLPAVAARPASPVAPTPAPRSGEIKVALAKLKQAENNRVLISSGVPFAPGQLKDDKDFTIFDSAGKELQLAAKVLARWPEDGSVRSVLVQFEHSIEQLFEYVTLRWGAARASKDKAIIEPAWRFPEGIIVMPVDWMTRSRVIGWQVPMAYREYDRLAALNFDTLIQRPKTGDLRVDDYYSNAHTYYQLFVRGGELKYFVEARKELLNYRDNEIVLEGKDRGRARTGREPRYVYMQAMLDDYLLTGDPRTLEVAGFMAEYLKNNFSPAKAFYPKNSTGFWTERVVAFPFLGLITYYEMTGKEEFLQIAHEYMENLYKTQTQWPGRGGFIHNLYAHDPEEGARPDEYGGSPFMTGLLLEAVVKYHQITGKEIAADSIFRAVDWILNEGLTAGGDAIKYMTADKYASGGGNPDLNMLVVHAFGYAYYLSGYQNEEYLRAGQKLFDKGLKDGFLGRRKHFNQNYRSSGHFLAYIQGGAGHPGGEIEDSGGRRALSGGIARTPVDVLHFEGFENTHGRFQSAPDTAIRIDRDARYLNGSSLHVKARYNNSNLAAGLALDPWDAETYGRVSFAYRIRPGAPVGMRTQTQFGDWICLGGTEAYKCATVQSRAPVRLVDDGQWHEAEFRADELVQSVLPAVNRLNNFQFFTGANAQETDEFWVDDFKIRK
jgi:hypothetical protein